MGHCELPSAHIIAVVKAALVARGDAVGDPLPPIQPITGSGLTYVRQVTERLVELEDSRPVEEQQQASR